MYTLIIFLDVPFNKADFPVPRLSVNHPNFQDFHREENFLEIFSNPMSMASTDRVMLRNIFNPDFKADAISYELFTQDNKEQAVHLNVNDTAQLKDSPFNPAWPVKIIIHGWSDNGNTLWLHDIRQNYLSVGDYNVICVNWSAGSNKKYLTSVKLTRQVNKSFSRLTKRKYNRRNLLKSRTVNPHTIARIKFLSLENSGVLETLWIARYQSYIRE